MKILTVILLLLSLTPTNMSANPRFNYDSSDIEGKARSEETDARVLSAREAVKRTNNPCLQLGEEYGISASYSTTYDGIIMRPGAILQKGQDKVVCFSVGQMLWIERKDNDYVFIKRVFHVEDRFEVSVGDKFTVHCGGSPHGGSWHQTFLLVGVSGDMKIQLQKITGSE